MTGAPLERGGGGAGVCRLVLGHVTSWPRGIGLYTQPSALESVFWGGGGGGGLGGGLAAVVCTLPCGGGGVRRWELRPAWPKKPGGVPGPWAPSRTNLGFAGGDSAIWYGMVWYGIVWYGMVWYGMVWYGMVWYGMVWYGMLLLLLLLLLLWHQARAGVRNCQTRSPSAGRKGAVSRRHAGRACANDDRGGGGGSPSVWGGRGRASL